MAKKSTKKSLQQFLTELAADAEKLGKFILDPESAMDEAKIGKTDRPQIKSAVAHLVHQQLVKPPDAFIVW